LPAGAFAACAIALAGLVIAPCPQAQPHGPGAYDGTINVSGTLIDPRGSYRASVRVTLPVSQSSDAAIDAGLPPGTAPTATAIISDWDMSFTEKSADADGKYTSWSCSLATTGEIPMSVAGELHMDLQAGTYAFSLSLRSLDEVTFDCTNSRSGPYKQRESITLYAGTGSPGTPLEHSLPFSDASHLADTYTLNSREAAADNHGPIIQAWDLRRTH